jgi:hypothetical protein
MLAHENGEGFSEWAGRDTVLHPSSDERSPILRMGSEIDGALNLNLRSWERAPRDLSAAFILRDLRSPADVSIHWTMRYPF